MSTNINADSARVNDADVVIRAFRAMSPSVLPRLVFTSLAAASVPVFSDRCQIVIDGDGCEPCCIDLPLAGAPDLGGRFEDQIRGRDAWSGQWVGDHMVQTTFHQSPTNRRSGYRVTVLHQWHHDYTPTGTDVALAQLAVDHAAAILLS